MTELNEAIVYDALEAIMSNSAALAALVNRAGTDVEKRAYQEGVYAPAIKLQCLLGTEALERGRLRREGQRAEAEAFVANCGMAP
jgi:hypothetical protein